LHLFNCFHIELVRLVNFVNRVTSKARIKTGHSSPVGLIYLSGNT